VNTKFAPTLSDECLRAECEGEDKLRPYSPGDAIASVAVRMPLATASGMMPRWT
jgi:hypothetical protein